MNKDRGWQIFMERKKEKQRPLSEIFGCIFSVNNKWEEEQVEHFLGYWKMSTFEINLYFSVKITKMKSPTCGRNYRPLPWSLGLKELSTFPRLGWSV